jgi:hypothetical protein
MTKGGLRVALFLSVLVDRKRLALLLDRDKAGAATGANGEPPLMAPAIREDAQSRR